MGADESRNSLACRLLFEFFNNPIGIIGIQVAINDGEAVTVVLDVKHIAVADSKALDDRHQDPSVLGNPLCDAIAMFEKTQKQHTDD
jgi:F420-0:gamma-glutamyl ligase-like protein